jgi:hypothetical protein
VNVPKPHSYSARLNNAGRFEFPYDDGLRSGPYAVSIQSPPAASPGVPIPAVYNRQTLLMISLQEGENQVDFDLEH